MHTRSTELFHYGIKGQKWGVRRYQNSDGTLTPAGKKRYDNMSGEELYKHAKKQIHKERAKQYGWSNQWLHSKTIGENSKNAVDARDKSEKEIRKSAEYKDAVAKLKKIEKKWLEEYEDSYKHTPEEIEKVAKEYDDTAELVSKIAKIDEHGRIGYVRGGATYYAKEFVNGYGKDISIGYLKDLGLDDSTARRYVDKMIKSGLTLGGL